MKKVSTGERIRFADLRRRSVGGPRGDADSDVMSEQLFVSELMDTTPSSSYEGETVRDAFVYNPRDPSVSDSPLARYDSDGEAADEVVTGTQEGVGKADLIVKEDVPEIPGETQQGSLLAVGLAAVKIGASQHGLAGPLTGARHRDDTLSDGESLMGDPRVDHGTDHAPGGCTAEQLIGSLVSECKSLGLGSELTQGTDKYVLRMADDDWDPDLDFPGLDSSAVITDVGVDQFVLCHQAKVEPMLHITIALHKGLNGPLTGTGAMEAPGAGATMTLEVDFQTPGQEGTHHMSMPIAPNGQVDLVRFRDSGLRSAAVSAAECEFEQLLGMGPSAKEQVPEQVQLPEKEQLPEKVLVPEKVQVPEKVPDQEGAEETAKQTPGQEGAEETVEQIPGQEGAEDTARQTPGQEGAEETVEQIPDQEGAEEIVKLRNMDTGEDIDLAEIKDRVPPSLDPGELFRTKNLP